MVYYSTLVVSFFIVALIIRIKRQLFFELALNSVAVVNELMSDYNEELKVELVQKKTNKLAISLLMLLLLVLIAFVVGSISLFIYVYFSGVEFSELIFNSFYSILAISIGATIPFLIPFKSAKYESGYSELSQLLHRMALNNYNIANKLFKREKKIISKKKLETRNDFVIISGLARAGTTSLMNDLLHIEDFVSLNYGNMPFLLTPNLWSKIYKPKDASVKERSHKDGIMIGLESNEALEEYFFKVKADDSYIKDVYLTEYELPEKAYKEYLEYQSLIKKDNSKIYLAKNNNFILRYNSVRKRNDEFLMVILFRDPLTHAASLMEKDKDYTQLQNEDSFVLEYMNWLGHHEFGNNQKPFHFELSNEPVNGDKQKMDYWLKSWMNYYNYVLTIEHKNTILVSYDDFCAHPHKVIETIIGRININITLPTYEPFNNKRKQTSDYSEEIYKQAEKIYVELNNRAIRIE